MYSGDYMGEVLSFDRRSAIDKYVIKALKNMIRDAKKIRKKNYNEIEESLFELDYLEGYIYNICLKIEKNGWKSKETKMKFLDHYSYLHNEYEFNSNFLFQEMVLALITDLNSKIIFNDNEYVGGIVNEIDNYIFENREVNIKKIGNSLSVLNNYSIKKTIQSDDKMYISSNIADVIDCVDQNYSIERILEIFKESNEIDNLDNGIITLDRIQNYCKFHTDLLFKIAESNENSDEKKLLGKYEDYNEVFNEIYALKHYKEKQKNVYIDMVINNIQSNESLINKLKFLRALTEVYLDYEELVNKLDYEHILAMVYFKKLKNDEKIYSGGGLK